jgi:hypothetical protein
MIFGSICPCQVIIAVLIFLILLALWPKPKSENLTMNRPGVSNLDKYDMVNSFLHN